MKDSGKKLLIFISWTFLIMIIVGIPGSYIPHPVGFLKWISPDKIVHLLMFAPFTVFYLRYILSISGSNVFNKYPYYSALIIGIVYAIFTELMQFFVFVGRNGNIYDAAADVIGVITGVYIFKRFIGSNTKHY